MSAVNQRTATVNTILEVLQDRGIDYEVNGPTPISEVLIDSDKATIRERLFTMFRNNEVTMSDNFMSTKLGDDSELKKYISGLVNNWIRKAKELNSGQAYVTKNPGSRAHVGDEQLKELMKLATQIGSGNEGYEDVMQAIKQRKDEIAATKTKTAPINIDALPEHLKHLASNND